MKCPVCDQINPTLVCTRCGFDASRDYGGHPTFSPAKKTLSVPALRREWEKKQPYPEDPSPLIPNPEKKPRKKGLWLATAAIAVLTLFFIVSHFFSGGHTPHSTTALTVDGTKVSTAELNHYYIDSISNFRYSYGEYVALSGLDTTKALDEQFCNEAEGYTWADYFIDQAVLSVHRIYALYNEAKANGFNLSEKGKASVDAAVSNMAANAKLCGYSSTNSYIEAVYGKGCSEKTYRSYLEVQMIASEYANAMTESLTYDEAAIRAEDEKNPGIYCAYTYNYVYLANSSFCQGGATNENGNTTNSDEEKEAGRIAAEAAANSLLAATNAAELDAAVAALEITSASKSTRCDLQQYASVPAAIRGWLTADRTAGDIAVIPNETSFTNTGGKETSTVNGYYVVLFESRDKNLTNLVNVRHILVSFDGGTTDSATGMITYSDEEKAAARRKAEEILAAFMAGENTEDSFAVLATEKTSDIGSKQNGGLFKNIYPGQMISNFNNWCFDAARTPGDTDIVETEYGYHIMYFVGTSGVTYRDYMIESTLRSEDMTAWENALVESAELVIQNTDYIKTDLIISSN